MRQSDHMAIIEVDHVTKSFNGLNAVNDVSFSVDAGEVLVIVGSSGCGKTTTLRCIAGLETPTRGEVRIEGKTMSSAGVFVPPEQRGIGMVFQSYALWPHKTVFDNVAYSLVVRRVSRGEVRTAVERALGLVGLDGMADRYPATLSGGQQQRVALARSLVAEPRVLLLDEPLSNLDAKLRELMRIELKHLIKRIGITAVHITHDQTEAMAIADRIICMRAGRIEQVGSARELYRHPVNRYVADFIGSGTFLDGAVVGRQDPDRVLVKVAEGVELWAVAEHAIVTAQVTLVLRPEDIVISAGPVQAPNALSAKVTEEVFLGDHIEYMLELGALRLRARSLQDLAIGSTVSVIIDPSKIICLPPESELASEPATPRMTAVVTGDPALVAPPRA